MDHHLKANPDSPLSGGGGSNSSGVGGSSSSSITSSPSSVGNTPQSPSRYEAQKRRDWNTFGQYLRNHRPPLSLAQCSGAHVLEFLRYLDQFGKTKVHASACPFFGHPTPPAPCPCPLRQAWGSLDALVGRLRAAFEEHGGRPEANPFGARAVRLYLREVRDSQAKARGIAYEKKRRKRPSAAAQKPKVKAEPAPEKMNVVAPPPPPPAAQEAADQGHRFFVPHPYHHHHAQFMHHHHGGAHFLLAPVGGGDASSVTASNNDSGGNSGGGDEMAMALAAAAEAHAAGCMLPLSVFN